MAWGKFDSRHEVYENDYCWGCGMLRGETERAHIRAFSDGGSHEAWNHHLLCETCHKDSEFLTGSLYWRWFHAPWPSGKLVVQTEWVIGERDKRGENSDAMKLWLAENQRVWYDYRGSYL